MHDVAVALDRHDVGHFDAAVAGNAADVVAAQVDQHHVLGPFLGIGQQFFGQPAVFFFVGSAGTRAGQRANGNPATDDADHDFRRAADQRHPGRAKIKHEGAGIDHAQRAVDFERMRLDFQFQALADHHLKDVAGTDVLDALFDCLLEFGPFEIRAISLRRIAGRIDVGRRQLGAGASSRATMPSIRFCASA